MGNSHVGPVLRTRAALTSTAQLAPPSNIHERGGKSVKDSVDSGIQNELTNVNGTHLHAPQTTNVYVGCFAGGRLK